MNSPDEPATTPRNTKLSGLLLVLLIALSALIQLTVASKTTVTDPLRSDAGEYFTYAYNLHNFGVYSGVMPAAEGAPDAVLTPDSARPPGYPLFLLMLGAPEPTDAYFRRVILVQAALGVLTVLLVYLSAGKFLGRYWAFVPAVVTALNPHLSTISNYLLTESLFLFLLMASIYSLQRAVESRGVWLFAATGALWGLSSLVRPTAEFFPPLMLIAVLMLPRLRKFRVGALVAFTCFALVMTPWVIRNQSDSVYKPGSSLAVKTLLHGSYPGFMYQNQPESFGYPYRSDPDSETVGRDMPTVLSHIADKFKAEPGTYTQWYLLGKPRYFLEWGHVQGWDIFIFPVSHTPYYEDIRFAIIRIWSEAVHWPLMILGLLGGFILLLRPRWLELDKESLPAAVVVASVLAYAIAFHIIAAPFPRYGLPFRPLLYALAMLPLRAVWLQLQTALALQRQRGAGLQP